MPCENYREALTEAAATDSAPSHELRLHLDACASCRAAFAEEQQLFAAIDTGLRGSANADVPGTFLPRVRASLENAPASQSRLAPFLIFAAASAAIVFTVFVATRPRHLIEGTQAMQNFSAPPREKPVTNVGRETSGTPAIAATSHSYRAAPRRNSTPANSESSTQLEVLVPPEEREAFAQFIGSQQQGSEVVVAVVAPARDDKDSLLSVKPLQIAELEVAPLESLASEVPDGTEEKR
jgi:hypothetical protein